MLKFNKGEWSEPYCLLKTMVDKKLFLCNSDLTTTGDDINIIGGNIANGINYKICDDIIHIKFGDKSKEFSTSYINKLSSSVLE